MAVRGAPARPSKRCRHCPGSPTRPRGSKATLALIGAFAFALLQEFFKSEAIFGAFAKHWHLGLGLTIIASVALLPRGLVGLPGQWRQRLVGRAGAPRAATGASR